MTAFPKHTIETAPDGSKPLLEHSLKAYGMVPNLHAHLAESPQTLDAYKKIQELFVASSLSTAERHVVWLAINVANNCHYCVPAHTMLALKDGVAEDVIEALRDDRPMADPKLEALRRFAVRVVTQRGVLSQAETDAFFAAGYTPANALDVLLGAAHKTISNFANHLIDTEVDAPFKKFDWTPKPAAA